MPGRLSFGLRGSLRWGGAAHRALGDFAPVDGAMQVQPGGRGAIGAVLAGGLGRRMGGAKALAELAGRPLIAYPLAAVKRAGLEPVVVAKPGSPLPSLDTRVIREPAEPTHPLCGILAALREGRPAIVLGCDMPFVPPDLLAWLAGLEVPVAAVRAGERLEPFPARLEPEVTPALREALDRGAPLREALAGLGPHIVGEAKLRRFGDPARITQSVNDPTSLAAAERHPRLRPARSPGAPPGSIEV